MQTFIKKVAKRITFLGLAGLIAMSVKTTVHADVPSAAYVYQNYYVNNPYVGIYKSNADGVAWTTKQPDYTKDSATGVYTSDPTAEITSFCYWPQPGVNAIGTEIHPTLNGTRRENTDPIINSGGYHYYSKTLSNTVIPVYWKVLYNGTNSCVPKETSYAKYGLSISGDMMHAGFHDIGWTAYCADCGKPINVSGTYNTNVFFYMSDSAASSIPYLFVGKTGTISTQPFTYVYACPHGLCLQEEESIEHSCNSFVSANRYKISYNKNAPDAFVDDSYGFDKMIITDHYYTNQGNEIPTEYEGRPLEEFTGGRTGWLNISKNEYIRPDYICIGWAATADRANQQIVDFTDGCSIADVEAFAKNNPSIGNIHDLLSSDNDKTITLYAVWAPCHNTLIVSGGTFPASGSNGLYKGQTSYSYYNGYYRTDDIITPDELTAPGGYVVTFDGQSGTPSNDVLYADTEFCGWRWVRNYLGYADVLENEFNAKPDGIKTTYTYRHLIPIDQATVTVTAQWQSKSLILPGCTPPDTDMAFTGWYTQPDGKGDYCGTAGSVYVPTSNITLYAYFGTLTISATEDYVSNDNNGASDLAITWKDASVDAVYQYYRDDNNHTSVANTDINTYTNVSVWSGDNTALSNGITFDYSATSTQTYTVPQTGVYTLDLFGAQGGNTGNGVGGYGGEVKTTIVLRKGDVLSICIGQQGNNSNTTNGTGGITNITGAAQSGGECSYISLARKSVWNTSENTSRIIMVAGGGGGSATGSNNYKPGGAGGSTSNVWNQVDSHGDLVYPVVSDLIGESNASDAREYRSDVPYSNQSGKSGTVGGNGYMTYKGQIGGGGGIQTDSYGDKGYITFHTHAYTACGWHDHVLVPCGGSLREQETCEYSGPDHPGVSPPAGCHFTSSSGWCYRYDYYCNNCGSKHPSVLYRSGYSYTAVTDTPQEIAPGVFTYITSSGSDERDGRPGPSTCNSYVTCDRSASNNCHKSAGYQCGLNCYENSPSNAYITSITVSHGGGSFLAPSSDYAHTADVFRAGVQTGNGKLVIMPPATVWDESYTMDNVPSPDKNAPDAIEDTDYKVEMSNNGTHIDITVNMPMDNGTNWWWMGKATLFGTNGSSILADYLGTAPAAVTKPSMDILTTGVVGYKIVCDTNPVLGLDEVKNATVDGDHIQYVETQWASVAGTGSTNGVKFINWYKANPLKRTTTFQVTPIGRNQYMHICAVDKAGNYSPVANLMIECVDGTDPRFFIAYPIHTNQMTTLLSDYVYANGTNAAGYKVYYVNSGSGRPLYLNYEAEFTVGVPRAGYQINDAIFSTEKYGASLDGSGRLIVNVANGDITLTEQRITDITYRTFGDSQLLPYAGAFATRYYGNLLKLTQQIYANSLVEGVPTLIYPRATAYMETAWAIAWGKSPAARAVMSTTLANDKQNGLVVIRDETAPKVTATLYVNGGQYGSPTDIESFDMGNLFDNDRIDRRRDTVEVKLEVADPDIGPDSPKIAGSGLKEWSYTICNKDNGLIRTVSMSNTTTSVMIDVSIPYNTTTGTYDNILFNGEFTINAYTADNVMNEGEYKTHSTTELDMRAEDHRFLDEITGPLINSNGERYYQEGEAGFIKVFSWGYADYIEVRFLDEELAEFTTAIVFDGKDYPGYPKVQRSTKNWMTEDNVEFSIPLYYGKDKVYIEIVAHKFVDQDNDGVLDDLQVKWDTALNVNVEGTILDEFRSTIRYN